MHHSCGTLAEQSIARVDSCSASDVLCYPCIIPAQLEAHQVGCHRGRSKSLQKPWILLQRMQHHVPCRVPLSTVSSETGSGKTAAMQINNTAPCCISLSGADLDNIFSDNSNTSWPWSGTWRTGGIITEGQILGNCNLVTGRAIYSW